MILLLNQSKINVWSALLGFPMEVDHCQNFVFTAPACNKPPDEGVAAKTPSTQKKISFKDMVMGNKKPIATRQKVDLFKDKLATIEYQDGNPLAPMVHIEDKVFEGLFAQWQDALVVKLLGKNIGYHLMKERLQRIWKTTAGFEIMDINNGYYMVKFDMEADRAKVMEQEQGPWMIFNHYLSVQCWSPDFASPSATIDKTMVWIRFPGLNLIFYDESILLALATAVGTPIKVDSNTLDVRRGRYARMCSSLSKQAGYWQGLA
jgi:hypothetical protein